MVQPSSPCFQEVEVAAAVQPSSPCFQEVEGAAVVQPSSLSPCLRQTAVADRVMQPG